MANFISDIPELVASLYNPHLSNVTLDSMRILIWKCECGKAWKECVRKRLLYKKCPKCEPSPKRKSKCLDKIKPIARAPQKAKKLVKGGGAKVCEVCCNDTFTKKDMVVCKGCQFECCKECVEKYILSTHSLAKCMKCTASMEMADLARVYGKVWVNTGVYYQHRCIVYLSMEKARFPEIMHYLKYYTVDKAKHQIDGINAAITRVCTKEGVTNELCVSEAGKAKLKVLHEKLDKYTQELTANMEYIRLHGGHEETRKAVQQYIQGCPKDGCKGLISAVSMQCEICGCKVCEKCHAFEHVPSVCDENAVLTAQSIKDTTKPCPKCAAPVYKVNGCDQMWCVVCHVAFSWESGVIDKGKVHNPEYFRWVRENGVIVEPIRECEVNLMDVNQFVNLLNVHTLSLNKDMWEVVISRIYGHALFNYNRAIYRLRLFFNKSMHDERIGYLLNKIGTDKFMGIACKRYDLMRNYTELYEIKRGLATIDKCVTRVFPGIGTRK